MSFKEFTNSLHVIKFNGIKLLIIFTNHSPNAMSHSDITSLIPDIGDFYLLSFP
jgi:hypothetical protein